MEYSISKGFYFRYDSKMTFKLCSLFQLILFRGRTENKFYFVGLSVHVGSVPRWRTRVGDIPPVPAVEGRFAFQRVKSIIVSHLATLFSDSTLPLPLMCCSVNVLRCALHIGVTRHDITILTKTPPFSFFRSLRTYTILILFRLDQSIILYKSIRLSKSLSVIFTLVQNTFISFLTDLIHVLRTIFS